MSAFFRGIMETVPSPFRGIFSERNSVPTPKGKYQVVGMLGVPGGEAGCGSLIDNCTPIWEKVG
jgi:hypothetical protein